MVPFYNNFLLTYVDVSVGKLGMWSDPFHFAGWLTAILASQADAYAEDDHGGPLSVQFPRVGRQVRHCERSGELNLYFTYK